MSISIRIQGSGKPLVFFHGWGFDSQIWESLLPNLSQNYQLYRVDLPGFGLTPPMDWQAFSTELLKQLPHRFILLGWSMGGLLATRLAIEHPDRLSHLVNIASSPRMVSEIEWPGVDIKVLRAFYQQLSKDPYKTLQAFIKLQLDVQNIPAQFLGITSSKIGLQAGLDILVNWDLRASLKQVKLPVSYMFGRLDGIVPYKTMATMQSIYPHFNYQLFAKASHVPFLSHPQTFIAALKDFLQ